MCRPIAILVLLGLSGLAPREQRPVLAVDVVGVIHPITVEIIDRAFDQAKQQNAAAILIRLNTAGGMPDAARQIVEKILASPIPVVTYVTPSTGGAASAGFIVLEGSDVAAMAPGTHAGAAHPFIIPQMDPVIRQKLENDAAASLRAVVAKRGRNSALAEKAVFEGQSFTDKEALDNKLIDPIARDERELLTHLDGREVVRFDGRKQVLQLGGANIISYERTVRENVLSRLYGPQPGADVADPRWAGNLCRIRLTGFDFSRCGGGHSGPSGPDRHRATAHQLAGRRPDGARFSAIRAGGQAYLARHPGFRWSGGHGSGRHAPYR